MELREALAIVLDMADCYAGTEDCKRRGHSDNKLARDTVAYFWVSMAPRPIHGPLTIKDRPADEDHVTVPGYERTIENDFTQ